MGHNPQTSPWLWGAGKCRLPTLQCALSSFWAPQIQWRVDWEGPQLSSGKKMDWNRARPPSLQANAEWYPITSDTLQHIHLRPQRTSQARAGGKTETFIRSMSLCGTGQVSSFSGPLPALKPWDASLLFKVCVHACVCTHVYLNLFLFSAYVCM